MISRILCSAFVLFAFGFAELVLAEKPGESAAPVAQEEKVISGILVSTTADAVVMTDDTGENEQAHPVNAGTAITLDGEPVALTLLAKGDRLKVTLGQDGKVTNLEATRKK